MKRRDENRQLRPEEVEAEETRGSSEPGSFSRANDEAIRGRKIIRVNRSNILRNNATSTQSSAPFGQFSFNQPSAKTNSLVQPSSTTSEASAANSVQPSVVPVNENIDEKSVEMVEDSEKTCAENFRKSVGKLNQSFTEWVKRQSYENPCVDWKDGVEDYLNEIKKMYQKFDIKKHNERTAESGPSTQNSINLASPKVSQNSDANFNEEKCMSSPSNSISSQISNKNQFSFNEAILTTSASENTNKTEPTKNVTTNVQPNESNINSTPFQFGASTTTNSSSQLFGSSKLFANTNHAFLNSPKSSNFQESSKTSLPTFNFQSSLSNADQLSFGQPNISTSEMNLPTYSFQNQTTKNSSKNSSEMKPPTFSFQSQTPEKLTTNSNEMKPPTFSFQTQTPVKSPKNVFGQDSDFKAEKSEESKSNIFASSSGFSFGSAAPSTFSFNLPASSAFPSNFPTASNTNDNKIEDEDEMPKEKPAELGRNEEEDAKEETKFEIRAKMFKVADEDGKKVNKDLGIGIVKILKDRTSEKCRILMRSDTGRVQLNLGLYKGMKFNPSANSSSVSFCVPSEDPQSPLDIRILKVKKGKLDSLLSKLEESCPL